jgi:hypothetical protein
MTDRSDEFRKAAADCLRLARVTSDAATRASLLVMAQRWFDLANGPGSQAGFDAALRVFNEGQMRSGLHVNAVDPKVDVALGGESACSSAGARPTKRP